MSLSSGTPSNLTGPLYQGVVVSTVTMPMDSSMARSNWAVSSLFITPILPEIVRIGLSVGAGRDPALARVAAKRPLNANSTTATLLDTLVSAILGLRFVLIGRTQGSLTLGQFQF